MERSWSTQLIWTGSVSTTLNKEAFGEPIRLKTREGNLGKN